MRRKFDYSRVHRDMTKENITAQCRTQVTMQVITKANNGRLKDTKQPLPSSSLNEKCMKSIYTLKITLVKKPVKQIMDKPYQPLNMLIIKSTGHYYFDHQSKICIAKTRSDERKSRKQIYE